ncbi:MAG: inositol monophosphatase [Kiritimatiellae bacterium]|nr:inositol monophosphatase [Kiritimatiellia bacterium]
MNANVEFDAVKALGVAEKAVREAGRVLLGLSRGPLEVLCEPEHDIKLRADQLAEAKILEVLAAEFPLPVLTEESGEHGDLSETSRMWVVDPLDGTFNYSRGMPMCCTSVGLWDKGEPVLGAVYDFFGGHLFLGAVGRGATLNGIPVKPSGVTNPEKAALATGFPHHMDLGDAAMRQFVAQVRQYKKIRMLGTAALMGAFVSNGWLDAYTEDDIWLWDIAAAAAIAKAAGATVAVGPGKAGRWARTIVCAATPELFGALRG